MASVVDIERRVCNRVLLGWEIEVCRLLGDDSEEEFSVLSCKAKDISEGGVSFYGDTLYPKHSVLRLRIPLQAYASMVVAKENQLLKVMGKVMWSRKDVSAGTYATGVQFLNIYEDDFILLNQYIQQILDK